jgi:hypothetical protein
MCRAREREDCTARERGTRVTGFVGGRGRRVAISLLDEKEREKTSLFFFFFFLMLLIGIFNNIVY